MEWIAATLRTRLRGDVRRAAERRLRRLGDARSRLTRTADDRARSAIYGWPVTRASVVLCRLQDEWLALLLTVLLWIEVVGFWVPAEQGPRAVALVLGTSMCALLVARRRRPLAAAAGVAAVMSAWTFAGPPEAALVPWLVCLVAIYAAAQAHDSASSFAGPGAVLASIWLLTFVAMNAFVNYVFVTAFAVGAWAAGRAVRSRQLRTRELAAEAARLAEESDRIAVAAAAEERRRIARELHDVVAHSMGVIVVQAQAAAGMLDRDAVPAREAVESIERTGREALGEMRRMVGLMRHDHGADRVDPLPSLRHVERLIAEVQAAGVPVELHVRGSARPLPPGVDASAYRILQEGLTNVIKHAGRARADVVIAYLADEIELSVRDDGRDGRPPRPGGHGLVGIRERVAVFDGTVEAGPLADGGWRLRARLPVEAGPP
jgi:signal transduction histidine kinase